MPLLAKIWRSASTRVLAIDPVEAFSWIDTTPTVAPRTSQYGEKGYEDACWTAGGDLAGSAGFILDGAAATLLRLVRPLEHGHQADLHLPKA